MSSDGSATGGTPGKYVTLDGVSVSIRGDTGTRDDAAPTATRTESRTGDKMIGDRMEDDTIYVGVSPDTANRCTRSPSTRR